MIDEFSYPNTNVGLETTSEHVMFHLSKAMPNAIGNPNVASVAYPRELHIILI